MQKIKNAESLDVIGSPRVIFGAPETIRTSARRIWYSLIYPAELQVQG